MRAVNSAARLRRGGVIAPPSPGPRAAPDADVILATDHSAQATDLGPA
jgi:hypothetical protein